jgi:hypothetical protein
MVCIAFLGCPVAQMVSQSPVILTTEAQVSLLLVVDTEAKGQVLQPLLYDYTVAVHNPVSPDCA